MISAKLTNEKRKAVYKRDGYRCALCDSTQYIQIHHCIVYPINLRLPHCHSHVHGTPLYDTDVTAEEMEQFCVEYLADYYAPDWNPWNKEPW